jgi:hypothetical protein
VLLGQILVSCMHSKWMSPGGGEAGLLYVDMLTYNKRDNAYQEKSQRSETNTNPIGSRGCHQTLSYKHLVTDAHLGGLLVAACWCGRQLDHH